MENSINLVKDFVTILVPVVTGYIVLFSGSIGKLWLEHRKDLMKTNLVPIFAGMSIIMGMVSISFCMGVMSLLLKASYGTDQYTFWRGVINSKELVEYAHKYLMIGWVFFVISIALGFTSYFYIIRTHLKKNSV
jgi:hypothetical protein